MKSQLKSEEASNFLENAEFMSMIQLFNENGFYHECSQWIYELLSHNPSQGSYSCAIEIGIRWLISISNMLYCRLPKIILY